MAGKPRRASSFAKGGRIVDATIRALPGRIGIDDVTAGAAIGTLDLPIRRPRVLRPQHLCTTNGAGFGADQSVFHGARFDAMRLLSARSVLAITVRHPAVATSRPAVEWKMTI